MNGTILNEGFFIFVRIVHDDTVMTCAMNVENVKDGCGRHEETWQMCLMRATNARLVVDQ